MSYEEHQAQARQTPVRCAVVTVSDTRTEETDRSGSFLRSRLEKHGHPVAFYRIIPDEPEAIGRVIDEGAGQADAVLLSGGTGLSRRDRTYDVLSEKLEKTIPGFGELFRMLSYEEIGSGAMLSRAVAGVYRDTLFFALPGALGAVRLAAEKLVLPELQHLVWELTRPEA